MCIIELGDPITVTVPDHESHDEHDGGCWSHHYVCYDGDGDGHADWHDEDLVCLLKGDVDHSPQEVGGPSKNFVMLAGSGSYAMNTEVKPRGDNPGQILLLDYEKGVANVHGSSADDFDKYLEPATKRHLGRVNVINCDGHAYAATREQLEWERDRSGGAWNP